MLRRMQTEKEKKAIEDSVKKESPFQNVFKSSLKSNLFDELAHVIVETYDTPQKLPIPSDLTTFFNSLTSKSGMYLDPKKLHNKI